MSGQDTTAPTSPLPDMGILKRLKSQLQSSASLSSAVSGKAYSTAAPPAEAGSAAAGDTSTASPLWAPSGSQESHQERQAPQEQPAESPQAQQSAAERAAREVEFHQDKAGLAAAFRTEFSGEQVTPWPPARPGSAAVWQSRRPVSAHCQPAMRCHAKLPGRLTRKLHSRPQ